AGEMEQIRDRHLAFFLQLAEAAGPPLQGADQVAWLDQLELERDNLRAALEWSRTAQDKVELGLRLAGSLESFWLLRGYFLEGREHLAAALSGPETLGRTEVRAKALGIAGNLAYMMSDYPATRALLEESLSLYRELGSASRYG